MKIRRYLNEYARREREAMLTEEDAAFFRRLQASTDQRRRTRAKLFFPAIATLLACAVLAIVLPVAFSQNGREETLKNEWPSAFESTSLAREEVSAESFCESLDLVCFPEGSFTHSNAYCYRYAESGERAYFLQTGLSEEFRVLLYVPMTQERFSWHGDFDGADRTMAWGGTDVAYRTARGSDASYVYASWDLEGREYFMEMNFTEGTSEGHLQACLDLLQD